SALRAHDFDVVMSDLGLPDIPGDVLIRTILDSARRQPHVIVITGDSGPALIRAKKAGASVIFTKPCDWEEVATYLHDLGLAAIGRGGTIAAMGEADFDEVFRVNVKGPWLALKAAIPLLRRGGAVVLNASINARLGMPGTSAYAASKAALRSFARTAASELAEQGVRVNAISPGPTDSGIIEKGYSAEAAAAVRASLAAKIPQGRLGSTDEIARVVLFLASDDSSFITGEEVVVDGGMTRV